MDQKKITQTVKLITGISILLMLMYCCYQLYSQHFNQFVADICNKIYLPELTDHYVNSKKAYRLFWNARWFFPLLSMLWAVRLYAVFATKRTLLSSADEGLFNTIAKSIIDNVAFVKALPLFTKYALGIIFIMQVIALGYFVAYIPYHYDEIYSYRYFSSMGILSSLVYYPVPNNHIFYNILTSLVLHLPIDEVVGMRLVSAIAGVCSAWYFFKIAASRLSPAFAGITTSLYAFTYPIVQFSMEGRGYGLMIFFVIACIYSLIRITEGKSTQKYLTIYTIAGILGFLTIPSFLYAYVPVTILLFLHFAIKFRVKDFAGFILSQVMVGGMTLLLYTPLIMRNTWLALTENNGVVKRDAEYIKGTIKPHLEDTWRVMTGGSNLSWDWILLLLGFAVLAFIFKKGYAGKIFCVFIVLMLVSPYFIIKVHQTIPFPRTWSYMAVPICLSIGLMLNSLSDTVNGAMEKLMKRSIQITSLSVGLVLMIAIVSLGRFWRTHAEGGPVDAAAHEYACILKSKLRTMSTIGISLGNLSFYLQEDLTFERSRLVHTNLNLDILKPNDSPVCDMVVMDKRSAIPLKLDNYDVVPYDNPFFIVYTRKGF